MSSSSHHCDHIDINMIKLQFSGEEGLGRYVDLHEFHHRHINLSFKSGLSKLDYTDYLLQLYDDTIQHSNVEINNQLKATMEYTEYLNDLLGYLLSFLDRTQPLMDVHCLFSQVESEFWTQKEQQKDRKGKLATALIEAKVKKLCANVLRDTIVRTRERAQNRSAMTYPELEQDRLADEDYEMDDVEEEHMKVCSNKKVPLGWDGKPIPYWLYKLHGLKREFKCEICGDYTYRGRREFEKHFQEERHQFGMQCLGIPSKYNRSFYEITQIADVKKLWEEIRRKEGLCKWDPELDEEFEDDDGNIYDKRTYVLMKTQGLI